MKKVTIILTGVILMTIASVNVNAQNKTATASTSATIIQPIAIAKTVDLNFGNIVAITSPATVTVSALGARTSSNPLSLPTATPGTITAAKFTVTGLADATYSIVVPAAFNVTSGSNTMEVSSFTTTPSPTGLLTAGTQELTVGATIAVGGNQPAGSYTNATALQITVAYN